MILILFIYLFACHVVCGILTHTKGANWNPHPLWWKCRVLTTGPPGKFPHRIYFKKYLTLINSVVVVQLLSHVQLCATPWTAACQASLSFTISWGLLKLMSIESVIPSNHLTLCCPLLPMPSIFPSINVLSNESILHISWPKYSSFSFSISPSKNTQDWFPLGWTGCKGRFQRPHAWPTDPGGARMDWGQRVGRCSRNRIKFY